MQHEENSRTGENQRYHGKTELYRLRLSMADGLMDFPMYERRSAGTGKKYSPDAGTKHLASTC